MKLNSCSKSHADFINKPISDSRIFIDSAQVPFVYTAKYIGMAMNAKLRWNERVKS